MKKIRSKPQTPQGMQHGSERGNSPHSNPSSTSVAQSHSLMSDSVCFFHSSGRVFNVSKSVWGDFAYLRILDRDLSFTTTTRIEIPDDMLDAFEFMTQYELPPKKLSHDEIYNFALALVRQCTTLGIDSDSWSYGKLNAVLHKCATVYATTNQLWDFIQDVFDPLPATRTRWIFRGNTMKQIVLTALDVEQGMPIDLRNPLVLKRIRDSPASEHETKLRSLVLSIL